MRKLLISVPDFRKEVENETKPAFYATLSKADQDDYIRTLVNQRQLMWACHTSSAAYNLALIIIAVLVLIDGLKVLNIIQTALAHYIGTK